MIQIMLPLSSVVNRKDIDLCFSGSAELVAVDGSFALFTSIQVIPLSR